MRVFGAYMAYCLKPLDESTILLTYAGLVGYLERAKALPRAVDRMRHTGAKNLLVDFTHAVVVEEGAAERADFIACAITAFSVPNAKVAFVGVSRSIAWPAELACQVRHVPAIVFPDLESAVDWLEHGAFSPVTQMPRPQPASQPAYPSRS